VQNIAWVAALFLGACDDLPVVSDIRPGDGGVDSGQPSCALVGDQCVSSGGGICCPPQGGVRFDFDRNCWGSVRELVVCSAPIGGLPCGSAPGFTCYSRVGDAGEQEAWLSGDVWSGGIPGLRACEDAVRAAPHCAAPGGDQ
jgi:hypothetical protein